MSCNEPFLGKFRGTVVQNNDPKKIGRVQVIVPDVSNVILTSWAMPCLPISGRANLFLSQTLCYTRLCSVICNL